MDRFYSSPNLFYTLGKKGIGCCGTVMSNRKHFPKEIVTKATRHNRGEYDYRSIGSLLAIVWIDKRSLYMLTTVHEAITHIQATVKRRRLDVTRQDVNCPPVCPITSYT